MVGSLVVVIEAWEEMVEQSPFDFDYVPMSERHRYILAKFSSPLSILIGGTRTCQHVHMR